MYRRTGGGVTLSGGEPTAQPAFCAALLDALRGAGYHTCLVTCGYCETESFQKIAAKADMVLYDLKHIDTIEHERLTGASNKLIIKNLHKLEMAGIPTEIRVPVISGLNDDDNNIEGISSLLSPIDCVKSIVLLGYHALGQSKIYDFCKRGADIGVAAPKQIELERLAARMGAASGKSVTFR